MNAPQRRTLSAAAGGNSSTLFVALGLVLICAMFYLRVLSSSAGHGVGLGGTTDHQLSGSAIRLVTGDQDAMKKFSRQKGSVAEHDEEKARTNLKQRRGKYLGAGDAAGSERETSQSADGSSSDSDGGTSSPRSGDRSSSASHASSLINDVPSSGQLDAGKGNEDGKGSNGGESVRNGGISEGDNDGNGGEKKSLPIGVIEGQLGGSDTFRRKVLGGHKWFVAIGIPTVDNAVGRDRRTRQRTSWVREYSTIYHPSKGPLDQFLSSQTTTTESLMTVSYLLGRHPDHNYELSSDLRHEADEKEDIIAFDMKEGKPATGKVSGGGGHWGLESEVGMSRKAFAWYCFCNAHIDADYYMKSDDDVFLRARWYHTELNALHLSPVHRSDTLYWGIAMQWGAVKGDASSKFYYCGGMGITLSRALVRWIATDPHPLEEQAHPFEFGEEARLRYKKRNMDHEDVMVGRWFYNNRDNFKVHIYKDCRFHDVHTGANTKPIRDERSLCIHHVKMGEYGQLAQRYNDQREREATATMVKIPIVRDRQGNNFTRVC